MKKIIFGMLAAAFMLVSTSLSATDCESGGVGSTTCTVTIDYSPVPGVNITKTATTSCGDGYYACCNSEHVMLHIKVTAQCKKNPGPEFSDI